MRIDIWSDFACPFCFIGKKHWDLAVSKFPHRERLDVRWHSFELDPQARNKGQTVTQMLAQKYRMTEAKARQMNEGVAQQGARVGIAFDFDRVILANTFDAHRLALWAQEHGRDLREGLFRAYFSEGLDVSDAEVLVRIAVAGTVEEALVRTFLRSGEYTDRVRADEAQAQEFGLSGVPAFVIAQKYLVSGAQPPEAMLEALNTAWEEQHGKA